MRIPTINQNIRKMKFTNKLFAITLAALFGVASIAALKLDATAWKIDKAHSSVNFEIRHFFSQVPGQFHEYDSEIYFSPDNLEESSIDVTINVNSIDTENEKRDGHLKTADFFNAEKWPTMTYTSSKIEQVGENKFVAHGTLTIKDVSTEFELPFTLLGVQDNPFQEGTKVAGISSEFKLLRNDFNVGTGDWVSDAVVGNEVNVKLNLELNTPADNS
jgi:polyisoprenoid-binding protein YceI